MVDRLRASPRLLAAGILGVAAVLGAGLILGSTVFATHPAPWYPELFAAMPPEPLAAPPGPGTYLPVPVVQQAYPLDCEAAALQAALAAEHVRVSQREIFAKLPTDTRAPEIGGDGRPSRWGDPFKAFVGDVQGEEGNFSGYGVYYPPIAAAATRFGVRADGHTGWTVAGIEDQIRLGNPVVVWVDADFRVRRPRHWTAWDGVDVPYIVGEHAVTVMGFDGQAGTITVVDVLRGVRHTFSTQQFAGILTTFDGMGVAISGAGPAPSR
jgi:uncharacterized protein YvpB